MIWFNVMSLVSWLALRTTRPCVVSALDTAFPLELNDTRMRNLIMTEQDALELCRSRLRTAICYRLFDLASDMEAPCHSLGLNSVCNGVALYASYLSNLHFCISENEVFFVSCA